MPVLLLLYNKSLFQSLLCFYLLLSLAFQPLDISHDILSAMPFSASIQLHHIKIIYPKYYYIYQSNIRFFLQYFLCYFTLACLKSLYSNQLQTPFLVIPLILEFPTWYYQYKPLHINHLAFQFLYLQVELHSLFQVYQ